MNWLQNHLIPCPFKYLTGIDCPGCGFQRSLFALIKGNLSSSLHLYPATIPFLLTVLFVILSYKLNMDNKHLIKKTLYMITGSIIIVSYLVKMSTLYS
jgi:L-lactate permease